MRALVCALAALLLTSCSPTAIDAPEQWRAVEVVAVPVQFGAETIGALQFRGGLALSSPDDAFGGLSGLEVLEDGLLFAVSDNGDWFEAQLLFDDAGALVGIANVRTAYMRDESGALLADKQHGDSEGLAQLPDGRMAVSFEQTQTIRIYDMNRDGPFGAARPGPVLAEVRRLPENIGLEAITATADGALLIGAEGGERATTPLWIAPLDGHEPAPPRIGYPLSGGFSLTALDRAPDGGFIALERFYAPVVGPRARITYFPPESLDATTAVLPNVRELARLDRPLALDNFEGIAAVRVGDVTRIYIVSDDNFSARQRTLLLAFDVVANAAP